MRLVSLSLLFVFSLNVYAQFNVAYFEALSLIKNKEAKKGQQKLEELFNQTQEKEKKGRLASILAFAPKDALKNSSAYYADYALKYGPKDNLDLVLKWYRIKGDYLFRQNNLTEAELAYNFIIQNSKKTEPIYEYALYLQGWVSINKKDFKSISRLWIKYLNQMSNGILRKNILYDYGKFYIESLYEKNFKLDWPIISEQENEDLYRGVRNGLSRFKKLKPDKLLNNLEFPRDSRIFEEGIQEYVFFQKNPCLIFNWINSKKPHWVNPSGLIKYVSACKNDQYNKDIKHLANNLSLQSHHHIAAQISELIKNPEAACQYYRLTTQSTETQIGLILNCPLEPKEIAKLDLSLINSKKYQLLITQNSIKSNEHLQSLLNRNPKLSASAQELIFLAKQNSQVTIEINHYLTNEIKGLSQEFSHKSSMSLEDCLKLPYHLARISLVNALKSKNFERLIKNESCYQKFLIKEAPLALEYAELALGNINFESHNKLGIWAKSLRESQKNMKWLKSNLPQPLSKSSLKKEQWRLKSSINLFSMIQTLNIKNYKIILPKFFSSARKLNQIMRKYSWNSEVISSWVKENYVSSINKAHNTVSNLNLDKKSLDLITNELHALSRGIL